MSKYDPSIQDGEDTIKILITTDNHVGYKETDTIRGDDSWITFEEVCQIAEDKDVDMMLHSGDLFHINKPSKKSIYNTMKSLRKHCMGDKPCELEFLSDPDIVNRYGTINYEDPNLNIAIPVFAISGNHDDATGTQLLLPLDLLSVSGLVNHFGKVFDNNRLEVKPLLLKKGETYLALYGMQSIKDERLYRILANQEIKFLTPSVNGNSWFNLMCVHQNHVGHSKTSYLPEEMLPGFLDFVVWGHEHECKPEPIYNNSRDFHTLQAGSSIATSLADGELPQKHVFILRIKGKKFDIEPVPLKSVRPFYMDTVFIEQEGFESGVTTTEALKEFLVSKVEELLQKARDDYDKKNNNSSEEIDIRNLPLIRLKVEYTGDYDFETPQRLSKNFIGRVANIDDIFLFNKNKPQKQQSVIEKAKFTDIEVPRSSGITINTLISQFVEQSNLYLLSEKGLNETVKNSIDKEDKNLLNQYIKSELKFHASNLSKVDMEDEVDEDKKSFKDLLKSLKKNDEANQKLAMIVVESDEEKPPSKATKQKKPSARKKTVKKEVYSEEEIEIPDSDDNMDYQDHNDQEIIDSDEEVIEKPRASRKTRATTSTRTRGTRGRGRGGRGSKAKPPTSQGTDLFSMLQGMH